MVSSPKKKSFSVQNISIEGNIGSGKTSFTNYFLNNPNIQVFPEPIDKWRNLCGHNLLDLYYADPVKWGFAFQMFVQKSLMDIIYKPTKCPYKIIERSIYSAKYTFVENMHNKKTINDVEYLVYSEWFDFCSKVLPLKIDLIIYIRTDPIICYHRIKERGRIEETMISLDLLNELHELHESWLIKKYFTDFDIPVLVLDGNQSNKFMEKHASQVMKDMFENIIIHKHLSNNCDRSPLKQLYGNCSKFYDF
ncbi:unnamed protein product [Gordionus sp. m RMFG-2023]|uniref:thymidine kinase 2, mitochondrial-like n=1 Tax=Gordionus sp. m RMFG-2023 TaxID=3053472 RepID=UPI0030DFD2BB